MTNDPSAQPDSLETAAVSAAVRDKFGLYVMRVFNTIEPGQPYEHNWHIDALAYAAMQMYRGETKRLIVNLPPRYLKSLVFSIALVTYVLGKDPTAKFICVSYAQILAETFSRKTREVMESDWYGRAFPSTILRKSTEDYIETTQGGFRLATSPSGSVTGLGADFIIIDDPIKSDDAYSETARERAFRYLEQSLFSRLNHKPTGRIALIAQRQHEDDPSGRLIKTGEWTHLNFSAIAVVDQDIPVGDGVVHHRRAGEALHAAREPTAELEKLRRQMSSTVFEAQYQQSPAPAEGLLVKRQWLHFANTMPDPASMRIVQSWDTALKGNKSSDYSVCSTWGQKDGKNYLLHIYRKQWDLPELVPEAERLFREHKPHALLIEDTGSGTGLIQSLRARSGINALEIHPRFDKKTRLINVTPMFERGEVVLPRDAPWLAEFLAELLGFPNARYDDQVDSIVQFLTWARDQPTTGTFEYDPMRDEHPDQDALSSLVYGLCAPRSPW